ncbi:MAG: glycosyltransferase [Clostridia bacterium]
MTEGGGSLKTIDIIVPCYNEGDNVERFFAKTQGIVTYINDYSFRYIFIDDGSVDDTLARIKN